MTYLELRDTLNSLSAEQLMQTVQTYSGDIDDTIKVCGTCTNTNEEMGESMCGFDTTQLFLVLV